MIRSVFAIMVNTLRQAWYHRASIWLWLAAAACAMFLPCAIKGDGTPEGTYGLLLTYVPIAIFGIVLIASTWLGAHALAAERTHLRLSMLRTKPVSGFCIWLGQWLAICIINTLAISVSMAIFFGTLAYHHRDLAPARQLVWQPFYPDESARLQQARDILAAQTEAAKESGDPTPSLQGILNRLRQQQQRVAPGNRLIWHIPLTKHFKPSTENAPAHPDEWRIRFQWRLDPMRRTPVKGVWSIQSMDAPQVQASVAVSNLLDGVHQITIPDFAPQDPGITLKVQFLSDPTNEPLVFFDVRNPVSIECQSGNLLENLARATILLITISAALAALSLALSACFSFPVAVFTAHGILLAILIASFAGRSGSRPSHSHGHTPSGFTEWLLIHTTAFLDALHAATTNLRELLPFARLSDKLKVDLASHALSVMILALLFPLACGLASHCLLARKEVEQ